MNPVLRRVMIGTISALFAFGMANAPLAQENDASGDYPCRAAELGRALDFWIGEWEVTDGAETFYGTNRIEWDAGGCAIHEFWEDREGNRGTSLFYFDLSANLWHQVWVTPNTGQPWGLKHKDMVSRRADGSVLFQGELIGAEGEPYLDRTTLTPREDGTVRQLIEVSMDGGATWRTGFDAIYTPAGG